MQNRNSGEQSGKTSKKAPQSLKRGTGRGMGDFMKEREGATLTRRPFVQIDLELLLDSAGKKSILYVYGLLWHYAGKDDQAWPSSETLCRQARVNRHDLRSSVQWLEENGYITVQPRPGQTPIYEVRAVPILTKGVKQGQATAVPRRRPNRQGGQRSELSSDPGSFDPGSFGPGYPGSYEPTHPGSYEPPNKKPLTRTTEQEEQPQQPSTPKSPPAARGDTPQAAPVPGSPCGKVSGSPQKAAEAAVTPRDTEQPPQAASWASEAPLARAFVPSSEPVAAASGHGTTKKPPAARDPFTSKVLPAQAVPDDLLDCQQLLAEWWSVKGRGRTRVAFERACGMLRRHEPEDRRRMLESAVVGGWQGLHEPDPRRSTSARGFTGYGERKLTQNEQSTLGALQLLRSGWDPFSRTEDNDHGT